VGSVKSNMGHSEASSTINSIIKALVTFEREIIPPNINFEINRPDIPSLTSGRLQVVKDLQKFKGNLIGVNSFGIGGTNSHVLLQKNPKSKINFGLPNENLPRLLLWSGRTEEAVDMIFNSVVKQPLDAEYIALLQSTQISTQSSNTYRGYGIFTQNKFGKFNYD
jgi:fatty acid synthase